MKLSKLELLQHLHETGQNIGEYQQIALDGCNPEVNLSVTQLTAAKSGFEALKQYATMLSGVSAIQSCLAALTFATFINSCNCPEQEE